MKINKDFNDLKRRLKKAEKVIRSRLRFCERQNGLLICKNCGLDERDINYFSLKKIKEANDT